MEGLLRDVAHSLRMFRRNPDRPEQLRAGQVSADYFRLFGAPMIQGRSFSAAEDRPNGDKVIVLSHGLWVRRFGSARVIGRMILLGGDQTALYHVVTSRYAGRPIRRRGNS